MSTVTTVEQTGNKLVTNYNVSKFLLGFNSFIDATHTAGGTDSVLTEGLVMGRIQATSKIVPLDKDAVDGSQYPVGCLVEAKTVTANASASLTLVNKGKIDPAKVTLKSGTTLTSDIDGRQLNDWLNSMFDQEAGMELTKVDNQ